MKITRFPLYFALIGALLVTCGKDAQQEAPSQPAQRTLTPGSSDQGIKRVEKVYDPAFIAALRNEASVADTRFQLAGTEATGQLLTVPGKVIPAESLAQDGYGAGFERLGVIWGSGDEEAVILYIDGTGIHDLNGDLLLDQVEAKHGYAWRLATAQPAEGRPARSVLIVIILDEKGEAASDELYIYWDGTADDGVFKATNLPEEWMGL